MKKDTDNAYGLFRFASHATIALAYILMFAQAAYANEATPALTVSLNIRDGATLVWSGTVPLSASTTETVSVTPTGSSDAISVLRNSVLGALITADAAQTEFDISDIAYYSSFDSFLINCIAIPAVSASARCYNWQYVVSGTYPSVGIDDYALSGGETIYLYFGTPRRVILSAAETVPTIPVTATAQSYDYTNDSWTTLSGAVVGATQPNPDNPWSPLEIMTGTSGVNGLVDLTLPAIGSYNVGLQSDYYGTTTPLLVRTLADNEVIVRIRNGVEIGFQGIGRIGTGTTTLSDSTGNPHDVSAKSALAALANTDASSGAFSVSGLDYYDSFGAFYIRCITLASQSCDNWQYAVHGAIPGVGADSYELSSADELYFFFGTPRRVSISAPEITVGEFVVATAEQYAPSTNAYAPALGYTIGVTQTNPDDLWSPLIIATSSVDTLGHATFGALAAGEYILGIAEDFYFPGTTLTVRAVVPPPPAGGGGGGSGITHVRVDIPRAVAFLANKQNVDGSFGNALLTDWAAIALASAETPAQTIDALKKFLRTNTPSFTAATDYERRAMALMALGMNPYTDTGIDYIARIASYFDGTQIGEAGLVNDDMFALIPLLKAGYSPTNDLIKKTAEFILSKQRLDGSWEGSVDLTAAGIQALAPLAALPNVPETLLRAKAYLKPQQQPNGGFGNAPTTAWVIQAIRALGEDQSLWTSATGMNPEDFLASVQQTDSGFEPISADNFTRVWTTAYAIPAAEGKSWNDMLAAFPKSAIPGPSGNGTASPALPAVLSAATSSENVIASSTPLFAPSDDMTFIETLAEKDLQVFSSPNADELTMRETNNQTGDDRATSEAPTTTVHTSSSVAAYDAMGQTASAATARASSFFAAFFVFFLSLLNVAGGFFAHLLS